MFTDDVNRIDLTHASLENRHLTEYDGDYEDLPVYG